MANVIGFIFVDEYC